MDYFTTEYKKNLDAKAAKERRCQENARQDAVEFFSRKFPAFFRMLHTEGYKISGGRVQDWSEEGFPEYTCREILINKNGKEVDFTLMSSMYFRLGDVEAAYDRDEYRKFLHWDPEQEDYHWSPVDFISPQMIDLIGEAFYEEPTSPAAQEISPAPDVYNRTYFAALAMNGLIASYAGHIRPSPDEIARNAYLIADAMQKLS